MNSINEAIAQANRNARALNMKAEGYYTLAYANWLTVEVYKPGNQNMRPDYTVNRAESTCTCPDFGKTGKICKHQMFVELMLANKPEAQTALAEAKEEAAMWNAVCAEYEARIEADDVPYLYAER